MDSEVVWIFTELSAILVMPTSLLRTVVFVLFKEAHFYAELLPVTPHLVAHRVGPVSIEQPEEDDDELDLASIPHYKEYR